jgi:hypothetical protein
MDWDKFPSGICTARLNFPENPEGTLQWKCLRRKELPSSYGYEVDYKNGCYGEPLDWAFRDLNVDQLEEAIQVMGDAIGNGEYWLCSLVEWAIRDQESLK